MACLRNLGLARRLAFSLAIGIVWWGSVAATGLAQTPLRYRFEPGQVSKYNFTQNMTMEMKLPGRNEPMITRMTQKMVMKLTTDEVLDDGSAKQRQSIERLSLSFKTEGAPANQEFSYDSASEKLPEGPLAEMVLKSVQPMVGAEWQQTISARGEISEVKVPEKMIAAIKANPGAAMMGNFATEEGLKQLSSQAAMAFPEAPLKADDDWSSTIDLKMPFGMMKTKKICTYVGPNSERLEEIALTTDVTFEPAPNAPATLKIVDNQSDGKFVFDNAQGRLVKSVLSQVTNMQINAGGQQIDQVVSTDVLFELDKGDGASTKSNQ